MSFVHPNTLTPQQILETSCGQIMKQGRFSVSGGVCLYRGVDGCMCAAGPFVPDEAAEAFEHSSYPDAVSEHWPTHLDKPTVDRVALIHSLQRAHDRASCEAPIFDGPGRAVWLAHVREVARTHHLDASFLP